MRFVNGLVNGMPLTRPCPRRPAAVSRRRHAAPRACTATRTRPGLANLLCGGKVRLGARAAQPQPGSGHGRGITGGSAGRASVRPWMAGVQGVWPLVGGGPARCLSVGTHGVGRRRSAVPPHPPPAGPAVTHPADAPARAAGPSSAPDDPLAAKAPIRALWPAAFASLRFAPRRPLTATFPGKIRHLAGGTGKAVPLLPGTQVHPRGAGGGAAWQQEVAMSFQIKGLVTIGAKLPAAP